MSLDEISLKKRHTKWY